MAGSPRRDRVGTERVAGAFRVHVDVLFSKHSCTPNLALTHAHGAPRWHGHLSCSYLCSDPLDTSHRPACACRRPSGSMLFGGRRLLLCASPPVGRTGTGGTVTSRDEGAPCSGSPPGSGHCPTSGNQKRLKEQRGMVPNVVPPHTGYADLVRPRAACVLDRRS